MIRAAYFAVIAIDREPSVRAVRDMTRRILGNRGVGTNDVSNWLRTRLSVANAEQTRNSGGTRAAPESAVVIKSEPKARNKPGTNAERSRARHKVLVRSLITLPSGEHPALFASDELAAKKATNGALGRSKPPSEPPPWVQPLRESARAIGACRIRDLDLDGRAVLGRYFAWRFANCTKSEPANIRRGAQAAVAFAKMADSKLFADLTLEEYVVEAVEYQERVLGGAPFHDPFAIRAIVGVS